MAITGPIPLPESGMDAFLKALKEGADTRNIMAKTAEQEAKNPYVGQKSLADLVNQQNINKYYGKNIESEIGLRGAQTGGANAKAALDRQLLNNPGLGGAGVEHEIAVYEWLKKNHPELAENLGRKIVQSRQQAAPEQQNINGAQSPNLMEQIRSQMGQQNKTQIAPNAMIPQEQPGAIPNIPEQPPQQEQQQQAPQQENLYMRNINADLAEKEAKAKYYAQGGGRAGGVTLAQQKQLQVDVKRDNPTFTEDQVFEAAGNLLRGQKELSDGTPISSSGMTGQDVINVQGAKATTAVKNQAANYDILYNNLKDFDIDAVKSFAGPNGVLKLAQAKAMMASNPNNPNIDPVARRYLSAMNKSIINMDEMRKAFGTSVVPDYVYKTIGKLVNPNDSIWNDPKQVEMTYKDMVKEIKKNRDVYFEKVKFGVNAPSKANNEEILSGESPGNGAEQKKSSAIFWGKDENGKPIKLG